MSKMKLLLDVIQDMRNLADSLQAVAEAMLQNEPQETPPAKAEAPAAPAAKPAKKVSMEQVRAVLAQLSHDGLTARVRAMLESYGAQKLSAVGSEHYAELLNKANELKAAFDKANDALKRLVDGGFADEAQALILEYGASTLAAVEPDRYEELMLEADELFLKLSEAGGNADAS